MPAGRRPRKRRTQVSTCQQVHSTEAAGGLTQPLFPQIHAQSNQHTVTALIPTVARRPQFSLPSKGGVKARPQVVVTRQGRQRASRVAVALVQEGREGRVHPLGALWAAKLLGLKHLKREGKGRPLNETNPAEQHGARSFTANLPDPTAEDAPHSAVLPLGTDVPPVPSSQTEWFLPHSLIRSYLRRGLVKNFSCALSHNQLIRHLTGTRVAYMLCGHDRCSSRTSGAPAPSQPVEAFTERRCAGGTCAPFRR